MTTTVNTTRISRPGALFALLAYVGWGIAPLFWKLIADLPAVSMLAQRVLWAMLVFWIITMVSRRTREVRDCLTARRLAPLIASAVLLSINWFTFLWCVITERVLEASLGYFLTPLVNVAFGMIFLGERLRTAQWLAVALAATGVFIFATQAADPPWLALVLAVSFGLYGLIRKSVATETLAAGTIETTLMLPVAAVLLVAGERLGLASAWASATSFQQFLLVVSGLVTALPLLWFAAAARRLPLSTLGFFQYIAPTSQFLLAVLVFGEAFGRVQLTCFLFIWSAVLVFAADTQIAERRSATMAAI